MQSEVIVFSIFLIFTGAAVLAGLALYLRQSMLVAYIALGALVGPWGLGLLSEANTIQGIGHVGIIFLLYLLGLNLHPQKLLRMLREATLVTLASSLGFAVLGLAIAMLFGYTLVEGLLVGGACMFSSTIIGLKLLPTTVLHHRHVGEIIISVLLLQDIVAILILLALEAAAHESLAWSDAALLVASLPALAACAYAFERAILIRLIRRYDTIQEFVFLVAIGWCLGIGQLGHFLGLSYEMGAFVAGVTLATSPIATFIAESLKPLRDFFLIMFFFSLGASFELPVLPMVALPATALALVMLLVKPLVFRALLIFEKEEVRVAREIGVRLGQMSEFTLLIAVLAAGAGVIGAEVSYMLQAATLITFICSAYVIMFRYPTPIAVTEALRRD